MEKTVIYLLMVKKFMNSKQKILRLQQLHYVQQIFQKTCQYKKTVLNGYVYDFSVDYDAVAVDDILEIHKYLMKKMTQYNKMFEFVKLIFISAMMLFGCSLPSVNSLKCISMNYQECNVRPQIVNVNSEKPMFFSFQY